uniref:Caffeoyl-CoA O-methyltransferase n=1 Tax=Plagiochasma appendiculatum TaxID=157224 RepID=A0A173FEI7_9MARC|nr:caffeoyl-CoA O-methyltransferase [Plagiochasma appendiculatum]
MATIENGRHNDGKESHSGEEHTHGRETHLNGSVVSESESAMATTTAPKDASSESDVEVKEVATVKEETKPKHSQPVNTTEKRILSSVGLMEYILESSVYPREHEQLKELRLETVKDPWNVMMSTPDEARFLQVLLKLMNAKNTMEIGVYTGYSLLATALSIPDDGKIIAMDINRDFLNLGWPSIEKAGVAHKIDFREGPAINTLDVLLGEEKYHNHFDFIFVDADKNNYINYHPRLLQLVRVGGLIAYDNTLWHGSVALSQVQMDEMHLHEIVRYYQPFVVEMNKFLAADSRIDSSLVSIGDGVTLCRRVV